MKILIIAPDLSRTYSREEFVGDFEKDGLIYGAYENGRLIEAFPTYAQAAELSQPQALAA